MASALTTRLAYVVSGDARVDETSRRVLPPCRSTLASRTSLNPGDPVAVDPAKDDLAFYPLLYWPIVASRPQPSAAATAKVSAFMRQGGTIVFDTRDALSERPSGLPTAETAWLRQLLADVDVPELEPVPATTWSPRPSTSSTISSGATRPARPGSRRCRRRSARPQTARRAPATAFRPSSSPATTSPAAGPADEYGEALYPLVPGDPRQHEMALRGGVNLVMYTLTGNYKADQVHVRDLLERLAH